MAFVVVESEKPESTIIIERHDFVDIKRVVRVGDDALSIKDIIRALRNDPERTDQLKAILMRALTFRMRRSSNWRPLLCDCP